MSRLQFDLLPVEIVHRILGQGNCSNAVTLTHVNKHLRSICADPATFRDLVKPDELKTILTECSAVCTNWWTTRGLDNELDWQICAKWAFADMKARSLCHSGIENCDSAKTLLKWLPELISQRHHVALNKRLKDTWRDDIWPHELIERPSVLRRSQVDVITRAAFLSACHCTVLEGLDRMEDRPLGQVAPGRMHELDCYSPQWITRFVLSFVTKNRGSRGNALWPMKLILTSTNMMSTWQNVDEQRLHWIRCMTLCSVMAGIMCRRLKLALDGRDGRMRRALTGTANTSNLPPPNAKTIPFDLLYQNMPAPYTPQEISTPFIMRHLPVTTSSSFIVDGEWCGYYCYSSDWEPGNPFWDGMMYGIFFDVTHDNSDHCTIRARGEDDVGPFSIHGIIFKTTGWAQMTKEYANMITWPWSAMITPFGIVGAWGEAQGGWLWLWKKDWSP